MEEKASMITWMHFGEYKKERGVNGKRISLNNWRISQRKSISYPLIIHVL